MALQSSMSELSHFRRDCNQVMVIDPFYNPVPLIIHGDRIHGAEDPPCDGRDGVTVSADVRGQEDRFFRRLGHCSESQCQRHDRQRVIRKAKGRYLCGSKCGQAAQIVVHCSDRVRERGGGVTAPPTLSFGRSTSGKLQNVVWRSPINRRRDRGSSGSCRRDGE